MAGTQEGARKANLLIHGADFYSRIGKKGGTNSRKGGFASLKKGKDGLTGPERARIVGQIGGRKSSRKSIKSRTYNRVAY